MCNFVEIYACVFNRLRCCILTSNKKRNTEKQQQLSEFHFNPHSINQQQYIKFVYLFSCAKYWLLFFTSVHCCHEYYLRFPIFFALFLLQPQTICSIESLSRLVITREDDITHTVNIYMQPDRLVSFMMEDRDALEFTLVLVGYHKLLTGKILSPVPLNYAFELWSPAFSNPLTK